MKNRELASIIVFSLMAYLFVYPSLVHAETYKWGNQCIQESPVQICNNLLDASNDTVSSCTPASAHFGNCDCAWTNSIGQSGSSLTGATFNGANGGTIIGFPCPSVNPFPVSGQSVTQSLDGVNWVQSMQENNGLIAPCGDDVCTGQIDPAFRQNYLDTIAECNNDSTCVIASMINQGICGESSSGDFSCRIDYVMDDGFIDPWVQNEDGVEIYDDTVTGEIQEMLPVPDEYDGSVFCDTTAGCYSDGTGNYYDSIDSQTVSVSDSGCHSYGSNVICGQNTPEYDLPRDSEGNLANPTGTIVNNSGDTVYVYPPDVAYTSPNVTPVTNDTDSSGDGYEGPTAAQIGSAVGAAVNPTIREVAANITEASDAISDAVGISADDITGAIDDSTNGIATAVGTSGDSIRDAVNSLGDKLDGIQTALDATSGAGEGDPTDDTWTKPESGEFTDLSEEVESKKLEIYDTSRLSGVFSSIMADIDIELPEASYDPHQCYDFNLSFTSFQLCLDALYEALALLGTMVMFIAYIEAFRILVA